MAAYNGSNSGKPGLYRSTLTGTSGSHTDISAAQGGLSGYNPSMVLDSANSRLLVTTHNTSPTAGVTGRPYLFRCNLDGTSCSHADVSAGQTTSTGQDPQAVIAGGRLMIVSDNNANQVSSSDRTALVSCALDGSSCAKMF